MNVVAVLKKVGHRKSAMTMLSRAKLLLINVAVNRFFMRCFIAGIEIPGLGFPATT